jgi:hypothetical protein
MKEMDPTKIVNAWITSLVRLAVAGVGGFFVRKGYVDQSLWESTVALLISGAVAGFWSLYEKYHVKTTVLTALSMPSGSNPGELQDRVATAPVTTIT